MERTLRCTLGLHAHWKTIHGLSNRTPPPTLNTSITFNNKIITIPKHISNCFTNTRQTDPLAEQHIQYKIIISHLPLFRSKRQSKNNDTQVTDKLNIKHLKHIGPLGLAFHASMLKTALNTHIIPHIWKLANISPFQNPTKK